MKIICIGKNYKPAQKPEEPVVFFKPDTAVLQQKMPFFIPDFAPQINYEIELLVRICRVGRHIAPAFAHKYYDALSAGVDFTAAGLYGKAVKEGMPWELSKGFDGSAVIGSWLDKNTFGDMQNINFTLEINGETVQKGFSGDMHYGIADIIAYVSRFFTLKIGDVIFTGSPLGGAAVKAGDFLKGSVQGREVFGFNVK